MKKGTAYRLNLGGNRLREIRIGYLFMLPCLSILMALVAYPLLYGFYISVFKTNLVSKWNFVGLKYYINAIKNPEFRSQLAVTAKFTFFVVLGHFTVGTILAVLLNRNFMGRTFFRAVLLLPWLFPDSVIALLFKWILNPIYGILNWFLLSINAISDPISWVGSGKYAFPVVVIVCIWKGFPMIMMMILSGLQSISNELYEAAKIDGADSWQSFLHITLPGLKPVLAVTLVLDTIWWFKHYSLVYVLTGGGPGNSTALISISIYKQAFENFNFGSAAAMSVLVFFVCFILGTVYMKLLESED